MDPLLVVSFVGHVAAATVWIGAIAVAAYAVRQARREQLSPAAFQRGVDGLLQATRWTGLVLPATGAYQTWRLYAVDALLTTTRGWLVVGMLGLWGALNGLIELAVYRMLAADGRRLGVAAYLQTGYTIDATTDVARQAAVGWPYLLAAVGLAALLVLDAGLLAAGVG